jgi:hypothetical protein
LLLFTFASDDTFTLLLKKLHNFAFIFAFVYIFCSRSAESCFGLRFCFH